VQQLLQPLAFSGPLVKLLICMCVLLCRVQAEVASCMLQQEQQESNVWNNLLQKLPQPLQTTAYMAQRDLVIGPFT
jgi:hypothetical protein